MCACVRGVCSEVGVLCVRGVCSDVGVLCVRGMFEVCVARWVYHVCSEVCAMCERCCV